jgi:hypothetical protein
MALSKRKVREQVRASGQSATAISYNAGISNSYLNQMQWGVKAVNPSAAILARLATVLGCRVGDFFDDDDSESAA